MNRAIAFVAVTVFLLVLSLLRTTDSADAPANSVETVQTNPQAVAEEEESRPSAPSNGPIALQRGADSHFRATVKINGTDIEMLVDSGASVVALSQRDAERAGIFTNPAEFSATAQGAGGAIPVKPIKLDRVSLGNIERRDVQGVVIGSSVDQSLLGQSFLRELGSVTVEGDTMTIK